MFRKYNIVKNELLKIFKGLSLTVNIFPRNKILNWWSTSRDDGSDNFLFVLEDLYSWLRPRKVKKSERLLVVGTGVIPGEGRGHVPRRGRILRGQINSSGSHIHRTCYPCCMSLPKNLKNSATEEHGFQCSPITRSHPTPFDVIYGETKETFTGHAQH